VRAFSVALQKLPTDRNEAQPVKYRRRAGWATYAATIALVGVGTLSAATQAYAQPTPPPPAPPPPPPIGAPYVPLVPGNDVLQLPGQTLGELFNMGNSGDLMNTLFPEPAAPPTPVRQMPIGPPPPPDPRFLPPPA
jgi:hypothetical protein